MASIVGNAPYRINNVKIKERISIMISPRKSRNGSLRRIKFMHHIIHKNQQKWYSISMKVLILITKSNWGGAQRYVYDLATNLSRETCEVLVMAGGGGPLIEKLNSAGIKTDGNLPIGRDVNLWGDIKAFFKLVSIIKEHKPDILHVNSSKIGGLGTLAGRVVGVKKIVFTAHGWAFNENRTTISKLLIGLSYWITMFLAHTTIAVSEATKYQVRNWPFVYNKITVVYNGVSTESYFSKIHARAELAKINPKFSEVLKSKEAKGAIVIGSVGELHHIKGYDYAIRGIHEFSKNPSSTKIIYIIIGSGDEKENIQRLINDLGLESSVILLGHVSGAFQYLKAFDLFLLPSLSEGFPYIALEAGLYGLPIIATAVGGIPEIVDDMKSGILIQARKSREIQYAIEFYIKHKKIQKEHGLAIHEKVLRYFSIEKMVNETSKIYGLAKAKVQ
jgi:glycosyltransferase involved in cell wall biosynthesis